MFRILVFSTTRVFAESLADFLNDCEEFQAPEPAASLDRFEAQIDRAPADLLLLDVTGLPVDSALRPLLEKRPDLPAIALALSEEPSKVIACADCGFAGYLPSGSSLEDLCRVMHATLRGELICSRRVAGSLMHELRHRKRPQEPSDPDQRDLTGRERQILSLVSLDYSNKEIARELSLSVATVKNHVHNILQKLGAQNRRAAVSHLRSDLELRMATRNANSLAADSCAEVRPLDVATATAPARQKHAGETCPDDVVGTTRLQTDRALG